MAFGRRKSSFEDESYRSPERKDENFGSMTRDFFKRNILKGLAGVALLGGVIGYATCTKYVRPDEIGIKQVIFSPAGLLGKEGIREEVYTTGLHLEIPGLQKIHVFPRDIQVLDLHSGTDGKKSMDDMRQTPAAHIQTSDGFFIDLDVSVIYHITDPFKLIKTIGAGDLYQDNGIMPKTEPALKETLGRLNPEDFYNPIKRVEQQELAKNALNDILKDKGIEVEHVFVRWPEYHKQVQERIEGRNLQHQLVSKNKAETARSVAEAELTQVTEEGKAAVLVAQQEGSSYVTVKTAEMDLYERKKKAEADLEVTKARAASSMMVNRAYEGNGSDMLIGLKMVEVFRGLDTIILPSGKNNLSPLDLEKMVKSFQIPVEDKESK
ncbi:SPFH domain-containing protein [Candidatus Pacearchaeota archaeon]|nr:SPFH domain-containing protein [Candidatus Pacearchaeota archaeon]